MTPEQFVNEVRRLILSENLSIYKDLFASSDASHASDPHWVRALELHTSLQGDERRVLFDIIRQVMVDTIANVLAILDGAYVEREEEDLSLSSASVSDLLSGDLRNTFLELEEGK